MTRAETVGTACIVSGIIALYVFLAGGYENQPYGFSRESVRYYHLLVDGFRAGHLSLPVEPPPELARMADPYDPVQRGDLGMHDASYYKGRYYLYFGVGPALVLFWPFRVLAGVHFSENLAVALFCAVGYLCSVALLSGFRRRYFPTCPAGVMWLGALLLGLGNFAPVMLTRSNFWEVPIACAYAGSCLGLWALWRGKMESAHPRRWWWLASAAFGVAVASRPHFVFAAAVVIFVGFWRWQERRRSGVARPGRAEVGDTLALLVPLTTIGIGLLIYNYLRFDSAVEFGQKYQIGGVSMRHVPAMDWRFIPVNFYYNFIAAAQFERYFPFIQVVRGYPGVLAPNYFGFENPFGVLVNLPGVWLALLAPLACWQQRRPGSGLGRWVLLLTWHFAAIAGLVLVFGGATNRYMVDFLPSLLLLSGIGLLALGVWVRGWRWRGGLAITAALGLTLYTSIFTLLAAVQYNGLFKLQRPALYQRLESWLNLPVYWWEQARAGVPYGPLEVTVRFPKDQPGRPEPILITGVAHRSDYLYVIYDAYGQSVQLAYDRTNHERVVSQPIPVDYGVPHRIGIQSGSLFPQETHPFFRNWDPAEVLAAKQTLRVTLDDVPYLVGDHPFFGATPEQVYVGTNPISDNGGRKFTGQVVSTRRSPSGPAITDFAGGGFLHLAVVLPAGQAGRTEAIVATGAAGRGDLLFIRYEDPTHVRLGFRHAGEEPRLSESVEITPGRVQLLEISFGSFYPSPSNARERELADVLAVRLNGRTIWLEPAGFHPAVGEPSIGRFEGGEFAAGRFSGEIVGQHTYPAARGDADPAFALETYWLESGATPQWGPVRLQLQLPTDQVGKGEPLLVTGASAAQGDYLWINYPIAGQALIGYEHTGSGGPHTGLVPLDFSQPLTLEVSLPSLYPSGTDSYFANRSLQETAALTTRARLKLNGAVRFDEKVKGFDSAPGSVTFGENRISQAFGTKFTGRILSIERGRFDAPEGLMEHLGPLAMDVMLPAAGSGREVLLATGANDTSDVLLVEYVSPGRIRFVARPARGEEITGELVEVDPAVRQELRIQWGGLYPDTLLGRNVTAGEKRDLPTMLTVTLNGKRVLTGRADFHRPVPQAFALGVTLGDNGRPFTGRIQKVRRLPR